MHNGSECRIARVEQTWRVYAKTELGTEKIDYQREEAKRKITSAYMFRTYCIYNNGKYDISVMTENLVRLWPDLETHCIVHDMHIKSHGDICIEMTYSEFLKDVTEIWEKREKLWKFSFKVEKSKHLMVMGQIINLS